MNKSVLIILLAAGITGAVLLAKKAYGLSQLNFQVAKVGPRWEGTNPYLDIDVLVQNPTNSTATVSAFVLDLIYNGQVVANAAHYNPVDIIEYGQTKIVFPFKLSLFSAATTLMALVTGSQAGSAKITLKGTITVNNIPIPVTITSNII